LKYFSDSTNAHEIGCYKLLAGFNIPVIKAYNSTENAILLDDINYSKDYRMGQEEDFTNDETVKSTAKWFKKLHSISKDKITEIIPQNNIVFKNSDILECKKHYGNEEFFNKLTLHIEVMNNYLSKCEKVLIHDDFYYKNFITKKDNSETIMFDFNYMKLGIKSIELAFIRKVIGLRSKQAELLFIEEYGEYDVLEYSIYTLYNHIDCLYQAQSMDNFPEWANNSKGLLNNGTLLDNLNAIIDIKTYPM